MMRCWICIRRRDLKLTAKGPLAHKAGGFSFGRRPTLPSETLRIPNRPRTAVTVRLSVSDMIVMVFPASTISRSCLSSSDSHGRLPYFLGRIILRRAAHTHRGAVYRSHDFAPIQQKQKHVDGGLGIPMRGRLN